MAKGSPEQYRATVTDSRGTVIGSDNQVYNYFLNERYAPLAHKLISSTTLIEEKTRDFVGREFVFDSFRRFTQQSPCGYFVIKGEAGIGKTAIIAHLVKTFAYAHHFVIAPQGITRPEQFLENICAQLIAKYGLSRPSALPADAGRDSSLFAELLVEVSRKLPTGEQAVILVDALDEAAWHPGGRENVLYLPEFLPEGVFIVVTTRIKQDFPLAVERSQVYYLDAGSPENRADALAYIRRYAGREAMQARLEQWGLMPEEFAGWILRKSEGNFMYLRHVLPAIEAGKFEHGTVDELPQGLLEYYERHWRQIRAIDEDAWVEYRQPVIYFLATAQESVTVWQISSWSDLKPARVLAAIRDWREFLDEEVAGEVKRYRIYHASFREFLAGKDELKSN